MRNANDELRLSEGSSSAQDQLRELRRSKLAPIATVGKNHGE